MLCQELAALLPAGVPVLFEETTPEDQYWGECDGTKFVFTDEFYKLSPDRQKYVVLHELAHFNSTIRHNRIFYAELERLIILHGVSWAIACEIEQICPDHWFSKI